MKETADGAGFAPPKLVKWRDIHSANSLEKETASWIVTDVKMEYYVEQDLKNVRFSRQYIFESNDDLGYLFWMPQKRQDPSFLFLISFESPDSPAVMMHSQRIESGLYIYPDRFSGTHVRCADFEISVQDKRIRLVWTDGAYEEA